MSLKSFLFGDAPSAKVKQKSTLTPEQERALESLLGTTQERVNDPNRNKFQGSTETNPTSIENLSLAALEERVMQISQGGSALEQETQKALLDLIRTGGAPPEQSNFEDFFQTNVVNPLTKSFDDKFKGIGRRFGGNELFSSDRQEADARLKEDFLNALVSSRSNLQFKERTSNADRLLEALGLADKSARAPTEELARAAGVGQTSRQIEQQDVQNAIKAFALEMGLSVQDLQTALAAVGTQGLENIALVKGGSTGFLQAFAQGAGKAAATAVL